MNEQQAQQARKQEMLRRHRCLRSLEQYLPDSKRQKTLFSEPTSSKRRPERLPQQVEPPILLPTSALALQDAQPQPQPPEEYNVVDLTEVVPLFLILQFLIMIEKRRIIIEFLHGILVVRAR